MAGHLIHKTPWVTAEMRRKLGRLDELRQRLSASTRRLARWNGSLRRLAKAGVADSSTAIEGFVVSLQDTLALLERTQIAEPGQTDEQAIACYAQAMDHVTAMVDDAEFNWSKRVVLDLQFDACYFQADKLPGRWRPEPIYITGPRGIIAYTAPDAAALPRLMGEVVEWLQNGDLDAHVAVRAAMAHLHVVSIHPFRDGNGRTSRIVQSLVLGREGLLAPEFASIEEWLADHTADYYAALNDAHGPDYQPERDASGWVEFCIDAHLEQAESYLAMMERTARRWEAIEQMVSDRGWPDRLTIALERALTGYLERAGYMAEADVKLATANLDLRRLIDAGLIVLESRGRVARYGASDALRQIVRTP